MEMRTVIQCILTAAQSFGSQDYYKKSRMMILGLADVLFCENEQAWTKWIIVMSDENAYLDACLGKLGEVSKQSNNLTITLSA